MLIVVILIGVGLRSFQLTARSLWFDEAFSWRLIQFPLLEMIARDAADVHPPLYYIALRGWSYVFGSSLLALRSFSVFFAGASIAAMYGFVSYAFRSRAIGLLAAALLALSAWQIAFAWEARMYTLGTFLALVSSGLLLKALRQGTPNLGWWLIYAVVTAAFAYVHYFAFFTIAAQALCVLLIVISQTRWRVGEIAQLKTFWFAVLAGLLMIGLYAPWVPTFLAQNSQVQAQYWVPPIGGWSIIDTFYRMLRPIPGIPVHVGAAAILAALPLAGALVLWAWLLFWSQHAVEGRVRLRGVQMSKNMSGGHKLPRDAVLLVALAGIVPFLLSIVISFVGQSLYQDRFLVFAHLFLIAGLAVLLQKLPLRGLREFLTAAALIGFVIASLSYWTQLGVAQKPGAHAATQLVFAERQESEPIIATSPFVFFAALHYAQEEFGSRAPVRLYSETGQLLHFAGGPILIPQDIIGPRDLEQYATVWLIETSGFGESELQLPSEWRRTEHHSFPEVFSYQGEVFVNTYQRAGSF